MSPMETNEAAEAFARWAREVFGWDYTVIGGAALVVMPAFLSAMVTFDADGMARVADVERDRLFAASMQGAFLFGVARTICSAWNSCGPGLKDAPPGTPLAGRRRDRVLDAEERDAQSKVERGL